ncbi:MAG: ATP-grasp domain-containing protein [Patescibacteria group bacterium]
MQKTVAVIRGGVGAEHDVSLKTGAAVLQQLAHSFSEQYKTRDIFIDKGGEWFVRGVPASPEKSLTGVDVVWNALHGEYGEDGGVQRVLERIGVPYTGSRTYASSVAMNKVLTKKTLESMGVKTPYGITLSVSDTLDREILHAFRHFPQPSVIKPVSAGSSVGVTLAKNFFEFQTGVKNAFQFSPQILIEEYIPGKEATVGVVEGLRGEPVYRLPPVEIVLPAQSTFFDYETKYNPRTIERCPGSFSDRESAELKSLAAVSHSALGLRHYSRSDFIVSPRGIYFLEVNTLPDLRDISLFSVALGSVGVNMSEFIEHILKLVYEK